MKNLQEFIPRITKRQLLAGLISAIAGVLLFGLVRFLFQPDMHIHYHANFAVFINGQRQEFKGPQFYQEIASCNDSANPQGRVHMHDNIGHVVHVHDKLVTWGNFFNILGWSLSDRALFDGTKSYVDGQDNELHFMLNGKPAISIANEVIGNEDRLLVSYGNETPEQLQQQFSALENDAHEYNLRKDPSACKGPEELSSWTRLQRAYWY